MDIGLDNTTGPSVQKIQPLHGVPCYILDSFIIWGPVVLPSLTVNAI